MNEPQKQIYVKSLRARPRPKFWERIIEPLAGELTPQAVDYATAALLYLRTLYEDPPPEFSPTEAAGEFSFPIAWDWERFDQDLAKAKKEHGPEAFPPAGVAAFLSIPPGGDLGRETLRRGLSDRQEIFRRITQAEGIYLSPGGGRLIPSPGEHLASGGEYSPVHVPCLTISGRTRKGEPFKVAAAVTFRPLLIDPEAREVGYGIRGELKIDGPLDLSILDPRELDGLWEKLKKGMARLRLLIVRQAAPLFSQGEAERITPPAIVEKPRLRLWPGNLLKNIFPPFHHNHGTALDVLLDLGKGDIYEAANKAGVVTMGFNPTWGGFKALHAIFLLMKQKGAKRTLLPIIKQEAPTGGEMETIENPDFEEVDKLYKHLYPSKPGPHREQFIFTLGAYLDAYGVPIKRTGRGELERDGHLKKKAIQDLFDLGAKQGVYIVQRKDRKGDKITTIGFSPLAIVKFEKKEGEGEARVKFSPAPFWGVSREQNYVLLDPDFFKALDRRGAPAFFEVRFLLWLRLRAKESPRLRSGKPEKIHFKELAYKLRLDRQLKNPGPGYVKTKTLPKLFDAAIKQGLLARYEWRGDEVKIWLNPKALPGHAPTKELTGEA